MGLDVTRVHPLGEQVDRLALARTFDTVDHDDDREPLGFEHLILHIKQIGAQFRHKLVVGLFVDLVAQFCRFEHFPLLIVKPERAKPANISVAPFPRKGVGGMVRIFPPG